MFNKHQGILVDRHTSVYHVNELLNHGFTLLSEKEPFQKGSLENIPSEGDIIVLIHLPTSGTKHVSYLAANMQSIQPLPPHQLPWNIVSCGPHLRTHEDPHWS